MNETKIVIKPTECGFRGGLIPNDYEVKQQVDWLQEHIERINEFIIKDTNELYIRELLNRIDKAIDYIIMHSNNLEINYKNKEDLLRILKGNDVKWMKKK